ncbi:hypothetical protein FKM82_020877 [Ascaphus truei]
MWEVGPPEINPRFPRYSPVYLPVFFLANFGWCVVQQETESAIPLMALRHSVGPPDFGRHFVIGGGGERERTLEPKK